ncbi:MAG: c-type cytochrome, methanol metabolism-related [Hyphomicrobiales bacterium]|nr:c-type cytochrome, methanol metabolism-related [Hyphomicrobiales bacterium]
MSNWSLRAAACAALVVAAFALPTASSAQDGKTEEDGKYMTKDSVPTYNIKPDGTTDWYTFSGFRRYHAECHVCHGPEGLGSTYAPALVDSVKTMSYEDFQAVIIQGRQKVGASEQSVMPSFGTNRNVVCYLDDLWIYLKARSDGAIPPGRPAKKDPPSAAFKKNEEACLQPG